MLASTFAHYATLATYTDRGTATRTVETAFGPHDSTIEFSTAFVRPDRFRFHLRHKKLGAPSWNHSVVCRAGARIRRYATESQKNDENAPSLDVALLPLLAPSIATAITIPHLLLPSEIDDQTLSSLEGETLLESDVEVNGHLCNHLAARHPVSGGRFELWINRALLIRRIFRPATASYNLTGTRIDYSPDLTTTPDASLFETASFD